MAKEFKGLETPTDNVLQWCIDAYAVDGYLLIDNTTHGQYYKPFEGSEPWDCKCVAIWKDSEGRVWAEEY